MILNQLSDESIADTVLSPVRTQSVGRYIRGWCKPHYPVPAIIIGDLSPEERIQELIRLLKR
jgi:hypothetical protein